MNEFLKNPDYGYGGQPYYGSTFMYMEEGGKLYFGPFWDCDICLGRNDYSEIEAEGYRDTINPDGFLSKQSHWISQLMEDETFVQLVKEKWALLAPEIEKMINETAPQLIEKIKPSQEKDYLAHGETYDVRTTNWGYRDSKNFWCSDYTKPIAVGIPDKEVDITSVRYAADRLNSDVKFTDEALKMLVKVPRPFLKLVLQGCVNWANENNCKLIDVNEMNIINDKRSKEKSKK